MLARAARLLARPAGRARAGAWPCRAGWSHAGAAARAAVNPGLLATGRAEGAQAARALSSASTGTRRPQPPVEGETATFCWKKASHNGVDVLVKGGEGDEPVDQVAFEADLAAGLVQWAAEGRNAVWVRLDIDQIHLSRAAHRQGFQFHNAKGRRTDLVKWLPTEIPNKVPPFGFHAVGVGALVLNSKNEILLVKERLRKFDRWKMPGGLVDPGESLAQAACREVREETGVKARFHSALSFWQRTLDEHQSDIYFVCRLTAEDETICFDEHEIAECTWMPLREYVMSHGHPMLISVLKKNFGISEPAHLDALEVPGEPLQPLVELALTSLRVHPSLDAFETFLARTRPPPSA